MLTSLHIRNLALVEDLSLDFKEGFTVLTGETGAGKSLLVDALALLVGGRADSEVVRQGTDRAMVDGVVEGPYDPWAEFLSRHGFPDEQPVVLRREVSAAGRSRAWINGVPCNTGDLREAGRIWMRLASQHDHQSLLQEERHLTLLDEVLGLSPDLGESTQRVREAHQALLGRRRSESERQDRLVWLEEHLEALRKLQPKPGEWTLLRAEREPLRHGALLEGLYREAWEELHQAVPHLETALRGLGRGVTVYPDAQVTVDRLRSTLLELEDLTAGTQDQALAWARLGTSRLEAVEDRLAAYERMARRHRAEPDDLAQVLQRLQEEQHQLAGGEQSLEVLEKALARASEAYLAEAEALHARRAEALPALEREAHRRLAALGMPHARLQVRLGVGEEAGSPVQRLGQAVRLAPTGFSTAALWIEPNVGEGFRPLARIASGGELSRVLLALLGSARSQAPAQPLTLVLDEVDAGLGGETALAVGQALHELATHQQVLAVTHLAQVAARAHHHGLLQKETRDGRTRSHLEWLQDRHRLRELARLLSGHPDREEALVHAGMLMER